VRWSLLAAGDFGPQRPPGTEATARITSWRRAWAAGGPSLFLANLELPLTRSGSPADKPVALRGAPEVADSLADAGIDVVSLANNHALDYGPEGLVDTMAALDRVGVAHVGAGVGEAAFRAHLREVAGVRVAVLAVASTVPRGAAAAPDRLGIATLRVHQGVYVDPALHDEQPGTAPHVQTWPHEGDLERVERAISGLKSGGADVVVVMLHWGVPPMWLPPYYDELADYQLPMARRLVAAGADALLGHHAHVPLPLRWVDGVPVAPSLGNFVYPPFEAEHRGDGPMTPGLMNAPLPPEYHQGFVAQLRFDGARLEAVDCRTYVLGEDGAPEAPSEALHTEMALRLGAHGEAAPVPVRWLPAVGTV
jgi:poly-gamma-glutamate capsule biosynthesis protein CapA/YwtB (metallophosphatase superfamily)